jgi:hypothetical protein
VYMVQFEEQEKLEPLLHSKIEYFERCCLEAEERRSRPRVSYPDGKLGHESQCALIDRCEDLCLRRGIFQRDLAREAGVHAGSYSKWKSKKIASSTCITWHQGEVITTAISTWCTQQEQAATC